MKYSRCFLHVDMDAFFASVEQLDHPEWRGKPVIVGGLPGEPRSVVSTASYEARKYGVHSAMPVSQAVKLCPDGIYTHGNYSRYSEISSSIMKILFQYSPDVNQLSIDEASINLTGTELLFGSPDELALKIKDEIFLCTGLTVSCGLASTSYHAKLASEMNKPDGFYAIPEGKEEDFILHLPLKKVWGLGDKTLQRLNKSGIFTTNDLHEKPLELLKMMLGESSGTFLYNTVHGIYEEKNEKPKSHSISNETTFPVDLTDIYALETALLELSYSVMFRLLQEKSYSKTVMIKIRYEDFSMVSIQETFEDYISSIDDLFEKAKYLFEKKYEFGRGIRLIGVALENVQDQNAPVQEVLFDFGEKKKKAVENAILKMTQKNPEIKIKKARMLKNISGTIKSLLLIFFAALSFSKNVTAEEYVNEMDSTKAAALNSPFVLLPFPKESPKTLFNYTKDSTNIEFITQGWWEGNLTGNITSTYTDKNGFSTASPSLVFKQQADLSLWFMLNRQWYLETDFADEFTKNTFAAGFYGKETNPLKSLRISNRGIFFPDTYSISIFNRGIGGGQNQAPGIMANFEDPVKKRWKADFALRYDMVSQQDATFYGKNSVSISNIGLENYITGQFFTLPENSGLLEDIKTLYVESTGGQFKDKNGRKFKALNRDQFLIIPSRNMLVISKDSGIQKKDGKIPSIAVSFNTPADFDAILGSYSDSDTFLGQVQASFPENINLKDYSFTLSGKINNESVLYLQENTGFSPFIFACYYDAGLASKADIILGSSYTENQNQSFSAQETEDFPEFLNSSFINEKHIYTKVFENSNKAAPFSSKSRYPLAKILPGLYLHYSENTDLVLIVRTYTPVSSYSIGTDAASGSVRVYKNGIADTSAKYDSDSGTVTLSSTLSDMDKIYITWNTDSESQKNGNLALQAGFNTLFGKYTAQDISFALNWTVSPYAKYSEYRNLKSGYTSIAAGTSYKRDTIELSNAAGFTFEKNDVTDLFRIEGFEDAESKTWYLGENALCLLSKNIVPSLNTEELQPVLHAENNYTTLSTNQKAVTDPFISGYKVPLEWNFPQDASGTPWASVNIKLSNGYLLQNADSVNMALEIPDYVISNYKIFLQLGIQGEKDVSGEISEQIPTWLITGENFEATGLNETSWHTVKIRLNDIQRSKLSNYSDARLIIIPENYDSEFINLSADVRKGIIYAGPYEICSKGIFCSSKDSLNVTTCQLRDNSIPEKNTFNSEHNNTVQKILWDSPTEITDETIVLAKYFEEKDVSRYKKIQFYFKNASLRSLNFILDRNSPDINSNGKECINATISEALISSLSKDIWHTLSVDIINKNIYIDDFKVPESERTLFIDRNVIPNRFKLTFIPENQKDFLLIDELHLKDSVSDFIFEDTASIKLNKNGTILKINNFPVLENAFFESRNNAGSRFSETSEKNGFINSTANAEITVGGITISGAADLSSENEKILASASQNLLTSKPLGGIVSFSDRFIFTPEDSSRDKYSNLTIDFSKLKIPVQLYGEAKSSYSPWTFFNSQKITQTFNLPVKNTLFSFSSEFKTNQKRQVTEAKLSEIKENSYFENYGVSTLDCFNSGSSDARNRNVGLSGKLSWALNVLSLKPALSFETENKYSHNIQSEYSDNTVLSCTVPFYAAKQNFQLKYQKTASGTKNAEQGGNYFEDFSQLKDSMAERDFYFLALPVYDFFSSDIPDDMKKVISTSESEKVSYSSIYGITWKHAVFNNIKDLFIPSSFEFNAERQITAAENSSDFYILKASLMNTPFNLFGSDGTFKMFNWFKTDEYIISLTGTAKIPKNFPEDTLWTMGFYSQASVYITDFNLIKTGNQFTLDTDLSWKNKNTVIYKRNSSKNEKLSQTDSFDLNFSYDNEKKNLETDFSYAHLLNILLTENFELNGGISCEVKINEELTTIIAEISAGGKLTF